MMLYFKTADERVFAYESHDEMMMFHTPPLVEISKGDVESLIHQSKDCDLSRLDVENLRKIAYSDPLKGSDVLFSTSYRMRDMGEAGWESKRQEAIDRFYEIQKIHPWPTV